MVPMKRPAEQPCGPLGPGRYGVKCYVADAADEDQSDGGPGYTVIPRLLDLLEWAELDLDGESGFSAKDSGWRPWHSQIVQWDKTTDPKTSWYYKADDDGQFDLLYADTGTPRTVEELAGTGVLKYFTGKSIYSIDEVFWTAVDATLQEQKPSSSRPKFKELGVAGNVERAHQAECVQSDRSVTRAIPR